MGATIKIEPEYTLFLGGKLEEENGSDIVSWMITSYYEQAEELAAVKDIAKKSKKAAKKRGESVLVEDDAITLSRPLITIVLNSPGGNYDELIAIYDTIQVLNADVRTIVLGSAMSAGALLAISGKRGLRYMTANSRLMFHAISLGIEGKAQDIKIDYEESERLNNLIAGLIVKHTDVTTEDVHRYVSRDVYVMPEEAIALGMVDDVIDYIE